MALTVLVTQCIQRDFVAPVAPHATLPNRLHVGHEEAQRLLGPEPASGPVAQLMQWARAQDPSALEIVHVRDWHDAEDPAQHGHLTRFGMHCVRGTDGARLVLGLDDAVTDRPNERFVDARALNDFEDTGLADLIGELKFRAGGDLRVGVVGVWTDAKVSFLLYDLKTRCRIDRLATCSALTASASRAQHFNALEQVRRLLGVAVHDSVGAFTEWLLPGGAEVPGSALTRGYCPVIRGATIDGTDRDLVAFLFRDSARLELRPLAGGYSGATVYAARSEDALGHEQAPSVVKLGPRALIGAERVAFERVESILGNDAPRVRGFVDVADRSGIKYAYAVMGTGDVRTFKSLHEDGAPLGELEEILRTAFEDVLGRFYAAAQYEPLPLLETYEFAARWAPSVRAKVEALGAADTPEGRRLCAFYETDLTEICSPAHEHHFVSYVHGDLNGANILVDARRNVWLIDFFHTARSHVLKDLAKFENDLLFIFTPLRDEDDLAQARRITDALRAVEDLRAPLPEAVAGVDAPELVRCWALVRVLRAIAGDVVRQDRDPLQLAVAGLRYAAHTLGFDESSPLQKRWALYAAGGHAEDVAARCHRDRVLRIDWLDAALCGTPGRIGITICPGRSDRGRDLGEDLERIATSGAAHLLCLLTWAELEWAAIEDLPERCPVAFHHLPVRDQDVPDVAEARAQSAWIRPALERGESVVVHCMGGLGRSGTLVACVLTDCGRTADEAIAAVRRARGPRAVETRGQERFVAAYAPSADANSPSTDR